MDNRELLILKNKLEEAQYDLFKFFSLNNDFHMDLIKILDRYKSNYFDRKKYEKKFSALFRIITNRVQDKDLDIKEYQEIKLAVEILEFHHPKEFIEFANIIKFHVYDWSSLGYNQACRLIYGETIWDILEKYL